MMGDIPIAGRQQKDAPTDEKSVHRTLFCTSVRTGAVLSSPSNRNQTKNPILPDGVLFGGHKLVKCELKADSISCRVKV